MPVETNGSRSAAMTRYELLHGWTRYVTYCGVILLLSSGAVASVDGELVCEPEAQCMVPWEFAHVDSFQTGVTPKRPGAVGPEHLVFSVLMWTYKNMISPVGGHRCGMYPSCSSYTQEAIQRLGPVVGVITGCDRLLRCGNDPHFYCLVRDHGRILRSDSVDNACRTSD